MPIFYYIYDPQNPDASLTGIEYITNTGHLDDELIILKGAEIEDLEIYARKEYAYAIYDEEELEVKYEGSFNSDTLGTQQIKLYVEGYKQYAITVNVIVIEPEKAPDIDISWYNGDLVFQVGATELKDAILEPYTEGEEAYFTVTVYSSGYLDNGRYGRYYYCNYEAEVESLTEAIEYIEKFGFEYKDIEGLFTEYQGPQYNLTLKFEYNQQETSLDYIYYYVKEIDATAA